MRSLLLLIGACLIATSYAAQAAARPSAGRGRGGGKILQGAQGATAFVNFAGTKIGGKQAGPVEKPSLAPVPVELSALANAAQVDNVSLPVPPAALTAAAGQAVSARSSEASEQLRAIVAPAASTPVEVEDVGTPAAIKLATGEQPQPEMSSSTPAPPTVVEEVDEYLLAAFNWSIYSVVQINKGMHWYVAHMRSSRWSSILELVIICISILVYLVYVKRVRSKNAEHSYDVVMGKSQLKKESKLCEQQQQQQQ